MALLRIGTAWLLAAAIPAFFQETEAFSSPSTIPASRLLQASSNRCLPRPSTAIYATDEDDDDDDDYDDMESSNLGDWRKFRASLIDEGLPGENNEKSVATENEALLEQQNKELAEEYRSGIWAHTIGQAEVGALLCRMPIEAELYLKGSGYWKDKLDVMISLSDDNDDDDGSSISSGSIDEDPGLLGNAKINQ
jgi:hypothetical protein